jgi:hypothetical protein
MAADNITAAIAAVDLSGIGNAISAGLGGGRDCWCSKPWRYQRVIKGLSNYVLWCSHCSFYGLCAMLGASAVALLLDSKQSMMTNKCGTLTLCALSVCCNQAAHAFRRVTAHKPSADLFQRADRFLLKRLGLM